jgi:flagellar hook-associated protein 2
VKTQVRDLFLGDSRSPGKNYRALRDLGVSIDKTGVLQFNESKFSEATSKNFDDVITFLTNNTENKSAFTSAAQGLAGDAVKRLNDMTRPTGFIQSQAFSAQKDVDRYKLDLEKLDERMKKLLERYTKTFSTLDSFVGQANSTMSRLKSTFDAMNGSNK